MVTKKSNKYKMALDTETSGVRGHSQVLELAWIIIDQWGEEVERYQSFIRPTGNLDIESTHCFYIHHITNAMAYGQGKPVKEVMELFNTKLQTVDAIIGHNVAFDQRMILLEFKRLEMDITRLTEIRRIDTMHMGRIDKMPKLTELYTRLIGQPRTGAHRALVDTEDTLTCFKKMKDDYIEYLDEQYDEYEDFNSE